MEPLKTRCQEAFGKSRKLKNVRASEGQVENVIARLHQIFSENELLTMDEKMLTRQVERVWPIAQYIDQK
jgi:hypothetical protein